MCIDRASVVITWLVLMMPLYAQDASEKQLCAANEVFEKVNGLLAQRNYEASAKMLDELRACPQLSPLDTFEMGWLYGRARHFDIALKLFSRVPQSIPDRVTHDYAVALSEFELSNYHGAVSVLTALQSSGMSDAKSANLLAVAYCKLGLYQQAYAVLTQELQRDTKDLSTYLNLVTVCAEGGDFNKAAEISSQAAALFPKSAEVVIVRGAANSLLGRADQAYQDFLAAARLAPERPDARFFLALTAYKEGDFKHAIAILTQATQDGLQDSDLHYLMAECLLRTDSARTEAAVAELNQAVQLNPNSVAARTLRGRLLLEKGKPAEAVADLEIATRLDPGSRSAVYNQAKAYRQLGRTEQAEVLFRKLRSEKPDILQEAGDRRLNDALIDKGANP